VTDEEIPPGGTKVADGTLAELSARAEAAGSNLEQIFLKVTAREA